MADEKQVEAALIQQIALIDGTPPKLSGGEKLPVTVKVDPVNGVQTFTYERKIILIVDGNKIEKPDVSKNGPSANPIESTGVVDPTPAPKEEVAVAPMPSPVPEDVQVKPAADFPDVDEAGNQYYVLADNKIYVGPIPESELKHYSECAAERASTKFCTVVRAEHRIDATVTFEKKVL